MCPGKKSCGLGHSLTINRIAELCWVIFLVQQLQCESNRSSVKDMNAIAGMFVTVFILCAHLSLSAPVMGADTVAGEWSRQSLRGGGGVPSPSTDRSSEPRRLEKTTLGSNPWAESEAEHEPFVTPEWAKVTKHDNGSWICERPWPQIEMFMPLALRDNPRDSRYYEFETLFLRSTLLFWQLELMKASLRILFDEEAIPQRQGVYNMIHETFKPQEKHWPGGVSYTSSPPSPYYRNGGSRQQLMMMWADNYTTSEYVAFVDSDAVFLTYVDREDLFEDGRPVINGKSGPESDSFWSRAPNSTYDYLRENEPMRCMSYFPVIVKLSHLKDLREYIVRVHGNSRTFDEIWFDESETNGPFQFNLICTYLFYFKRDHYKFYAHPTVSQHWDGIDPPVNEHAANFSVFDGMEDIFEPKPRIATHARYRGWKYKYMMSIGINRIHMNLLMQQGICLSPPIVYKSAEYKLTYPHRDDPVCENITFAQKPGLNGIHTVQELGYYEEMHIFEFLDWGGVVKHAKLRQHFIDRTARIGHCHHHEFHEGEYSKIMRRPEKMDNGGWRKRERRERRARKR